MASPALMPVKLLKPMFIGDADEARPVGYVHQVTPIRAKRWIAGGLAEDPSGKIAPPPAQDEDKQSKGKGKKSRGEDGDDQ